MLTKKLQKNFCYTAYTWTTSQLTGSGTKTPTRLTPLEKNVKKISMSDNHFAVISKDNNLFTWGENTHGQLGIKKGPNGHIKKKSEPTEIEYFKEKKISITKAVLGKKHTIALSNTGRVFSWGKGEGSKNALSKMLYPSTLALGHGDPKDLRIPKPIQAFREERILQISSGNDFAMALSERNSLWVWGRGEFGVLGFDNKEKKIPVVNVLIEALKENFGKIVKIDSCSDFSSVVFESGYIFSFGNNDYGNLGIGYSQSVDTCDAITQPTEIKFASSQEPVLFKDVCLAEQNTAYKSFDNKIYFTGRKLHYYPKLFEIDYDKHNVIDFTASDKGVAVLTDENRIFYHGNFWNGKVLEENKETGIKEADVLNSFEGKIVKKIGGKYSIKYVLVEDN